MRRATWRLGLLVLALGLLAAVWGVRVFGADALRELVVREARRELGVDVQVGALRLTLLPPRVEAEDVEARDEAARLLRVRRLGFDLAVLRSLWDGAWIGDLTLDEPVVEIGDAAAAWQRLQSLVLPPSTATSDESSFRPRTLAVRAARLDVASPLHDVRGSVRNLSIDMRLGGLLQPRFEFEAAATVSAERGGQRLDVDKVSVQGKLTSRGITIDSAVFEGAAGPLRVALSTEEGRLRGRVDWQPFLDPIFALVPEAGIVRGSGRIHATLDGTIERPEATAALEATGVRIHDVEFSGSGELKCQGEEWTLERARVRLFGGEAEGKARGKIARLVPFEAQARFSNWDPRAFVRSFGTETPLAGSWNGEARLAGDLFGDDLRGSGQFTLAEGGETASGTASFTVSADRAEVDGKLGDGAADEIRARYRVVHHSQIAGDIEARSQRLRLFGRFVKLQLDGKGTARAEFTGTIDQPKLAGEVDLADLAVEGIPLGSTRGPFVIDRRGVQSERLELADGEITASGRVAVTGSQQNEWNASFRGLGLGRVRAAATRGGWQAPELLGKASGAVQLSGPWSALRLRVDAELADLVVASEDLGSGRLGVTRDGQRWAAEGHLERSDGASLQIRGARSHDGTLSAELAARGWHLEKVSLFHRRWPMIRGGFAARGEVTGSEARPRGTASLELTGLDVAERALGDGDLRIDSDGERVVVAGTIAGTELAASAALRAPNPFEARLKWRALDVAALALLTSSVEIRSSGEATIGGDPEHPLRSGTARVSALQVGRGDDRVDLESPADVRIADGAIEVREAVRRGSAGRVTVGGRWTADEASFQASVSGDLSLLESLSSGVASARGPVDAQIRGSRRGEEPWHYHGSAALSAGTIDLAFLVGATDITGKVSVEDRRLDVRELVGKVGGGDFRVGGSVVLDGDWNLDWAVRAASLGVPSWLDYRASGRGRVVGPIRRPLLEGEIDVDQALYDRPIEWAEFLPWFRKQTRPAQSGSTAAGLPLELDLHVFADGGLFVDNNLAKAEMRGDLRLHGTPRALGVAGAIDVLNGEFLFRRRRFTISSGTVRFRDDRPMNPDLEFDGETRVATRDEEYEIIVRVSGTADNPRIEFNADDPSLTENDVLALVTFGRTVAQLQSQGAGIELGEALTLATGPRAGEVEKELHTLLPVDRIEIEPSFSRVNGSSEPRLSVAKDVSERFSAVIGTGVGSERNQDIALEYKFTRRFSLQGIWESQTKSEAGAFGANLRFRVPFRTLPRFSLLARSRDGR